MTRKIYMVRHGKAAAGFDSADPGLDALGRSQADEVAKKLLGIGPIRILSSPLQRTRETAMPLSRAWNRAVQVEEAVAEIPTPAGLSVTERVPWLRSFMSGSWRDADANLAQWRETVIATLIATSEDSVVFSHFIAINVALGHVIGDDRVVIFAPDNCSVTIFETDGVRLKLIERGAAAVTAVG
jgi:broad specificity phosphatase PhoE